MTEAEGAALRNGVACQEALAMLLRLTKGEREQVLGFFCRGGCGEQLGRHQYERQHWMDLYCDQCCPDPKDDW